MATWQRFEDEAGGLATEVRRIFLASRGHVLATLRRDGSPRVSGVEVAFQGADLTFGSMLGARKAQDLARDGRFALHSTPAEGGDAKISGVAVELLAEGDSHLFRFDLAEVVHTALGEDGKHLLIRLWRPGLAVEEFRRY
ncbi:pyridoxamine 5'-phosphate oxidase family protein [Saccharothrix violaceirubra]|uniref:Pyridoxamine 5'-phosphate oxidase N-terminal domain-containing protein n=1 Tax=Saccharothrix violaceirubra TaxID=413306 RepID=A0A7W7WZZ7_9PSEU|nr:pyridoxamine 5'-phosphate oxidase family protein [Saccharothrix violaceirubra]MBB4969363.1 hypothetical protein [Saccharothrix violaceirubra]